MASINRVCSFGRQLCLSESSQVSFYNGDICDRYHGVLIWLVLPKAIKVSRHVCRHVMFVSFGPYVAPVQTILAFLPVCNETCIFITAQAGVSPSSEAAVLRPTLLSSLWHSASCCSAELTYIRPPIGCSCSFTLFDQLLVESDLDCVCMWPAHWVCAILYPIWSIIPLLFGLVKHVFSFSIIHTGLSFNL